MNYLSFDFYIFLILVLILYYCVPLRVRWIVLLSGSVGFYFLAWRTGWWILLFTVVLSYVFGRLIETVREKGLAGEKGRILLLAATVAAVVLPWLFIKNGNFFLRLLRRPSVYWITPLGISFYTLQIVSYLADIHLGRIRAQRNLFKYALFALFFPQIVQGPIPRYDRLGGSLYEGHRFEERTFVKGLLLIVWGFFLKLMIADKAAVVVNTVFGNPDEYMGVYVFVAGALYSLELYTDFLSCVSICQGVSGLFGIELADNFQRPYLAVSIKDFWRRWHISLSTWLRDYIYIPLGGSRKGRLRKYINLSVTFLMSGLWHGGAYRYLAWGALHALYQIAGEMTEKVRDRFWELCGIAKGSGTRRVLQRTGVFFWATMAWILFRARSLTTGLKMLRGLLVPNIWVLFDDSLLRLGLDWKEWYVLFLAICVLALVSYGQERGKCVREYILQRPMCVRWSVYIAAIVCVMVFGTYGIGYNAQDFIYGGF